MNSSICFPKLLTALIAAATLTGCTVMPSSTPATSNLSGNWQIQAGSQITWPTTGVALVGALQNQGSQLTGTFSDSGLLCGDPLLANVTGSIDSAGNLTLAATPVPFVNIQLAVPTNPATATVDSGTVEGAGMTCALAFQTSAVGVEIASLTGTFAGTVTASASTPPAPVPTGTVTATLTQSATPNATGQFPLTGTVTFTSGTCSISTPVSGAVSGLGVTFATSAVPVTIFAEIVSVTASTNPTASQLAATGILFTPSPCSTGSSASATYTGTLTRQ